MFILENEFSSYDQMKQKTTRSLRVYKNKILNEEHGNRKLELWLYLTFGNEHIEERDVVFFLPTVLTKIIFQYCAEAWDPYTLFEKSLIPSNENDDIGGMFFDVWLAREKTSLLCLVPTSLDSNLNQMEKKTFILTVVSKEKLDLPEEEVRISYQIQRWDISTWEKCDEILLESFNNKWVFHVQLELNLLKKQIILFSSQFRFHGEWIIYIYDLETCVGKEFLIPFGACIGGIYENQLVYSYRSDFPQETYQLYKMDLTTKIGNQKIFSDIELYSPWRIHLLKYHPNFIFLFFLPRYASRLKKVEIWNHLTDLKKAIVTFDKCDEIWEFFSFPFQKETTKKDDIILGVYCCEEKKNRSKIDPILNTKGKYNMGNFLQISTKYFVRFTTSCIYIYEIKSFLVIQKLEFFGKEIVDVFYSPIEDNRLWIVFKNGEVKIF